MLINPHILSQFKLLFCYPKDEVIKLNLQKLIFKNKNEKEKDEENG